MRTAYNPISIFLFFIASLPVFIGFIMGISTNRIMKSMISLIKTFEILGFFFISFWVTKNLFFIESSPFYQKFYHFTPDKIKDALSEREFLAYIIVVPIILVTLLFFESILLQPVYSKGLYKLGVRLNICIKRIPSVVRRIIGTIWNIPEGIVWLLLAAFMIHGISFFSIAFSDTVHLKESNIYGKINQKIIQPVLKSQMAKSIPIILNNSFALEDEIPEPSKMDTGRATFSKNADVRVIYYFNGVTLEEAVQSDEKIDAFSRSLASRKKFSKEKGKVIYDWITQHMTYDEVKARNIVTNAKEYRSGAREAFYARKGICFDFAALYVAMCRANDLKVSLITGIAYDGTRWGDHAWNGLFCNEENQWIDVDPTFGKVGNYFNSKNFNSDHRYEKVRQIW